jgi:hypothetical protein
MTPVADACAAAVLYANAGDVDSVFVAGRALKRGGKLLDVDLAHVCQRLAASRDRIVARAGGIAREGARGTMRAFFPLE